MADDDEQHHSSAPSRYLIARTDAPQSAQFLLCLCLRTAFMRLSGSLMAARDGADDAARAISGRFSRPPLNADVIPILFERAPALCEAESHVTVKLVAGQLIRICCGLSRSLWSHLTHDVICTGCRPFD